MIIIICTLVLFVGTVTFAHSGRTDSSGGHKDNGNVSGLGSYHYHHGMGPHLHTNGICPYSPSDTISIENQPSDMIVGDRIDLLYTVTYYSGSSAVSFETSDSSVVEIEGETLIAHSIGSADITAVLHNGTKVFTVEVSEILADSIEIIDKVGELEVGKKLQLQCEINPQNTTNQELVWQSERSDVASVSPQGEVTALEEGQTVISAQTGNGIVDSFKLNVLSIKPESIGIVSENTLGYVGDTAELKATVFPEDTSNQTITWTSSDPSIATIDSNGKVQFKQEGSVVFTANCQECISSIELDVKRVRAQNIIFDKELMGIEGTTMEIGEKVSIATRIVPENTTYKELKYVSSNEDVVKIEDDSLVTVGYGTAIITASNLDTTSEIEITVVDWGRILLIGIGIIVVVRLVLIVIVCAIIKKRKKRRAI